MDEKPASFNQRLLAHSIDLTLILPAIVLLFYFLEGERWLLWSASLLVYHVYFFAFEASPAGTTPGKRLLQLEIRDENGQRPGRKKVALRTLLKWVSLLSFFIGFFMIYFSPKGQALHDYFTGTLVISKLPAEANW